MNQTRRQFLRTSTHGVLLWTAAQSAPSFAFNSVPYKTIDHFFVFMKINGGWDTSLCLDPWIETRRPDPKDMFIEYTPDQLISTDTEIIFGPAALPLKAYAKDSCVINGIFLSPTDSGHGAAMNYMTSGSTKATAPDLCVEMDIALNQNLPYGVVHNSFARLGNRKTLISATQDLKNILSEGSISSELAKIYDKESLRNAPSAFLQAIRTLLNSSATDQLYIESHNRISASTEIQKTAALIAASFLAGASQFANFDFISSNLDTHGDHPKNHMQGLQKVLGEATEIFDLFKSIPFGTSGSSLYDHTTFLLTSEFSRTPFLNGANGKDHNPMSNSALLVGKGLPKGKVFGGTRLIPRSLSAQGEPYHIAFPIDYNTGKPMKSRQGSSHLLRPENLMKSILNLMNVPLERVQSISSKTPALPGF
ncbi:MAG: DUF1501 domain-containing protein [Bdellovibrionales bacterium]|nr:DUF1501 domain-containing protein [Bdellovibrionales bacterium]